MVFPPAYVWKLVFVFFVQNLFQPLDRSRVKPRRPALALPYLRARLFQRLRLEVVPL
jgi:hypothetical protein